MKEELNLKIKELLEQIGRPYEMFNQDGTYQGCFYPVQFLYPDKPRYKLRSENHEKMFLYGLKKIQKNCDPVSLDELEDGHIVVTKFKGVLHVGIYLKEGKIIHVFKDHTLQIGRLKMFKNIQAYKVI